jgi:hypothetical protein
VWLVLVGILSVQFGAVVSKGLFGEIPPPTLLPGRAGMLAVHVGATVGKQLKGSDEATERPGRRRPESGNRLGSARCAG